MSNAYVKKTDVIEAIHQTFKEELDNLQTVLEDGKEVYANMDMVDMYIDLNRKLGMAVNKIEWVLIDRQRAYIQGWNEGRRNLVDAMEREIAI